MKKNLETLTMKKTKKKKKIEWGIEEIDKKNFWKSQIWFLYVFENRNSIGREESGRNRISHENKLDRSAILGSNDIVP